MGKKGQEDGSAQQISDLRKLSLDEETERRKLTNTRKCSRRPMQLPWDPKVGGVGHLSQAGLKDKSHPWGTPGPPSKLAFEKKKMNVREY